jgi:hypothetical protein
MVAAAAAVRKNVWKAVSAETAAADGFRGTSWTQFYEDFKKYVAVSHPTFSVSQNPKCFDSLVLILDLSVTLLDYCQAGGAAAEL